MKIAIWGLGSVGIGLASALSPENSGTGTAPLLLIGRNAETRAALAKHGIHRTGLFGDVRVSPDQVTLTHDPECLREAPPDWLLVCVKSFATPAIAERLRDVFPDTVPATRVLLCQNGWGSEQALLPFWPREQIFHARIITGFHLRAPHQVEITAHASPIALGSLSPMSDESGTSIQELAHRLTLGGLPSESCADMRAVIWAKMLYNCALNPLGALAGKRYGELIAAAESRALVEAVIREIFEVLHAAEISVEWPNAEAYLDTFHRDLIPPTAAHESSMLQDLRARRPTEIEALCGAVEQLGHSVGVATPVVSSLAMLVRVAEMRPRAWIRRG